MEIQRGAPCSKPGSRIRFCGPVGPASGSSPGPPSGVLPLPLLPLLPALLCPALPPSPPAPPVLGSVLASGSDDVPPVPPRLLVRFTPEERLSKSTSEQRLRHTARPSRAAPRAPGVRKRGAREAAKRAGKRDPIIATNGCKGDDLIRKSALISSARFITAQLSPSSRLAVKPTGPWKRKGRDPAPRPHFTGSTPHWANPPAALRARPRPTRRRRRCLRRRGLPRCTPASCSECRRPRRG